MIGLAALFVAVFALAPYPANVIVAGSGVLVFTVALLAQDGRRR